MRNCGYSELPMGVNNDMKQMQKDVGKKISK